MRVWRPASGGRAQDLYQTLTNGAGGAERLVAGDQVMFPSSGSRDGRFLLYMSVDPETSTDLWVVPMVGEHTPSVFLKTPFREAYGAFSPDGRWVANQSNESGSMEVYVRPFVPPSPPASADKPGAAAALANTGQWQVSTAGGIRDDRRDERVLGATELALSDLPALDSSKIRPRPQGR